ncbi:hypothetical protein BGZ96_012203 [Linnemannia gamsii]|uniref:RanBP2-type domain-containing protein n=1 Tax=Linnemannia gamsii TaxID=64522 RepID=A0ABQ7JQU9_9FUNG|nr:hypothetical protein BGZ96_012203 [Linnemannia gamsii]
MESSSKNRFQPYARRARQQVLQPDRTKEIIERLPKPLVSFVKQSLQWFGILQAEEDSDHELDRELHTTNGDFEFLPGADKEHEEQKTGNGDDKASKHDGEYSKLYPDLRNYLDSLNAKQSSELDSEELAAAMTPEKITERLRLRKELMDSTKGLPIPSQKEEATTAKATREDTSKNNKSEVSEPAAKSDGETLDDMYKAGAALSPAEINLVMRMRRLQKQAPAATNPSDIRLLEEYLPNVNSSTARPHQESRSTPRQDRRGHDNFSTRSQEQHGLGRSQLRHEPSDVVMSSQDAAEDRYDQHDRHTHSHSQSNHHCACGRDVQDEPNAYPGKRTRANRSPFPVSDEDMNTQHGNSQEQEKPKKKRNIRKIPGRFTALDSSDEEEDQRQFDLKAAERKEIQKKHAAYSSPHNNQGAPLYHTPPQIYPTLQYGVRTKLYNPRIDEALKWGASAPSNPVSLDSWRCPNCEQRTRKTSSTCLFCKAERPSPAIPNTTPISTLKAMMKSDELHDLKESFTSNPIVSAAISAAPAALGALATAGVTGGAFKAISSLISESRDTETTKKADAPKAPALFPMTAPAPPVATPSIATAKDTDKEPEKEKPKAMGTWASIGFKGPDNSGKWKCGVCDSYSKDELDKCAACETPKPGAKPAVAVPNMFAVAAANATSSSSDSKPAAAPAPALFSFGTPSSSAGTSTKPAATAAPAMFSFGQPSSTPSPSVSSSAPAVNLFAPPTAKPTSSDSTSSISTPVAPGGFVFQAPTATPAANATKPAANFFGLPPASTGGDAPKAPSLFSMPTSITATSSDSAKTTAAPVSNPFTASATPIANPFALPSASAASAPAPAASSLFGVTTSAPALTLATSKPTTAPMFSFGNTAATTAPTTPTTPLFSTAASTAAPMFGAIPAATTGASLFGAGSASATTTAATTAPLFGASTTTTPAPAFGVTATSTPAPAFGVSATPTPSLFGGSSTAPASTSSMFGGSSVTSPAKPAPSSLFGSTTTPAPVGSSLFGTPAASAATTSAPAAGSSMFSFSSPSTTFGAKPAATTPSAASPFSFGAGTPATSAAAAPASTGFGGFGSSSTSGFSMTTPAASTASANPSPFAFGSATAAPTAAPSFGFGSSTHAASPTPTPAAATGFGGGFGSSANPSTGPSSSSSPFAFGNNSASGGFTGFGQNAGASPSTSMSMGATPTNPNNSGGFGGNTPAAGGFGMFGAGSTAPAFGASTPTPTIGFNSANQSSQASPFGQQGGGGFGQSNFNSPMGGAGGFGASSGMTGFGAPAASGGGAGGFGAGSITLAGGAGAGGFGGQASGGGFGAPAGNTGAFGFQGMPTAPGGSQYTQPSQPAAGGFAFNMGVNTPTPGSERKIAKMRKKRN